MKRFLSIVTLCVIAALSTGCASSPQSHFFTLSPLVKPTATGESYSVEVGPVSVPAIVDRPQIVVRRGPNEVEIDEFNRWASPLKDQIAGIVVVNLGSMLGTANVTVFPQSAAAGASYRVVIDVLRFESAVGETATLDAVWTVRSAKRDRSLMGRTTLREPIQDAGYPALVAAHSRVLLRLSSDIAEAIRTVDKTGK